MKAHKRKVNMKVLCREQSERESKEKYFPSELAQIVLLWCISRQHLRATCRKSIEMCTRRSSVSKEAKGERKTFSSFPFTSHSMEYSWDPCSTFHDGMRRYSQNREKCEKLSACIFHLSVVLFSGRRTYSFLPPFDEHINSPWVPCCSQILHSRCVHCSPHNPNKKGKENSRREKGKKNFFQLSTLFRNYFLCFFIFPSFPFQSFASIS